MKKRILSMILFATMVLSCMGAVGVSAADTVIWNMDFDNPSHDGNWGWTSSSSNMAAYKDDGVSLFSGVGAEVYTADGGTKITYATSDDGTNQWHAYYTSHGELFDFVVENQALKFYSSDELTNQLRLGAYRNFTGAEAVSGEYVFSFAFKPVEKNFLFRVQPDQGGNNYYELFDVLQDGTVRIMKTATDKLKMGSWNTIAFVSNGVMADGLSNQSTDIKAYLNGELINTVANVPGTLDVNKINFTIWSLAKDASEFWLDDLSIVQTNASIYSSADSQMAFTVTSSDNGIIVDDANLEIKVKAEKAEGLKIADLTSALEGSGSAAANVTFEAIGNDGAVIADTSALISTAKYIKAKTAYNAKIYDVKLLKQVISASSEYTVDNANATISGVVSGTTVSDFLGTFTFADGVVAKVLNGTSELDESDAVDEGMTLSITSDGTEYTYSIARKYLWNEDFTRDDFTTRGSYTVTSDTSASYNNYVYSDGTKLFDNVSSAILNSDGEQVYGVLNYDSSAKTYSWAEHLPDENGKINTFYHVNKLVQEIKSGYDWLWMECPTDAMPYSTVMSLDRYFYPNNPEAGGIAADRASAKGAYNVEFTFGLGHMNTPEFVFEIFGCTDDGKEVCIFKYDGTQANTTNILSTTATNASTANKNHNFKIVNYGNGYADAYMDGTKVVDFKKLGAGDINFLRFKTTTIANKKAGYFLDDIKVYPTAYVDNGVNTISNISVHKDSVSGEAVTTLAGFDLETGNYVAKVSVDCQSVYDVSGKIIIAAYSADNSLQGVACGVETAVLKGENKTITATIDAAKIKGANRVQAFFWNGDTLVPITDALDINS